MKLLFIRHGETDANLQRTVQGCGINLPLNSVGTMEAETAGFNLKSKYKLPVIYCSNLERAKQTAQILAGYFQAEVLPLKGLEEVCFGEAEGMPVDEFRQKYADVFAAIDDLNNPNAKEVKIPGGESVSETLSRALKAIESIKNMDMAPCVGVVTHASLMCNIYRYFFGVKRHFGNLEYFELEV